MIPQSVINQLCQIPITDYLASKGHRPVQQQGGQWVYYSPLHEEKTPSFFVHPVKNVWNDFGGDNGSLIRLVRLLENCDFLTAIRTLQGFAENQTSFSLSDLIYGRSLSKKQSLTAVKLHQNPALVAYTQSRRISYPIARRYLRDVYYRSGERVLFAVGFANDKQGYVLRNAWSDQEGQVRQTKRNLGPSAYTTVAGQRPDVVNVFEGVFDFLSALEYYQQEAPSCPTIVLNSTTNLEAALPLLKQYGRINAYFDHDRAGAGALAVLQASGSVVTDRSEIYTGYNDFNDYWQSRPP
ncbi:toprim domain-containing protein [Spirosoma sp. RP8]|uniref:Toprim domain-containing protein n=1 Tax=Spirosoma liriopis TaxID=2937440 RepID=A0ABT0HWB8_9BACT|nr:toprim domain-containing protein [Spirosoma liriopis]MCK8495908.1 toprim domain-containing protein [Spirosoma liriopis]